MELRKICVKGASNFLRISRSTIVNLPIISNLTRFFNCLAKSLTIRGKLLTPSSKGRI
ncbi:hypothetical protein [Crocosphaera sp.]|uniref:hypothetical protein n=1 Tax=Crocosphaera sp. TaxID=2729996 RepID=UPI00338EB8B6